MKRDLDWLPTNESSSLHESTYRALNTPSSCFRKGSKYCGYFILWSTPTARWRSYLTSCGPLRTLGWHQKLWSQILLTYPGQVCLASNQVNNKCIEYRCVTQTTSWPLSWELLSSASKLFLLFCSDLATLILLTLLANIQRRNWKSTKDPRNGDLLLFNPTPLYCFTFFKTMFLFKMYCLSYGSSLIIK